MYLHFYFDERQHRMFENKDSKPLEQQPFSGEFCRPTDFLGGAMQKTEERWISGLGGSPGAENGNSLQCSCLKNPMDRGAWWVTFHGITELDMTEQLTSLPL